MKHLKLFENKDINDEIEILKKAKSILSSYKESPAFSNILIDLDDNGIDYYNWDDFDIIMWYLNREIENKSKEYNI